MRSSDRVAGYGIRWAAYQRPTRAGERGLKTRLAALVDGTTATPRWRLAPFTDIEAYLSDSRGLRCPTTRSITICAASWTAIVFGVYLWHVPMAFGVGVRDMRQPRIRTPYLQPRRAAEPSTRRQSRGNKSDGAST
jgi:hypothetical protein